MNRVKQDYKRDVRGTVLDDRNEVLSNANISWMCEGTTTKHQTQTQNRFKRLVGLLTVVAIKPSR